MLRHARTLLSIALLAGSGAVAQAALTPPFDAVYVFGDSISDGGNNYLTAFPVGYPTTDSVPSPVFTPTMPYTQVPPPPVGITPTFSNGQVWVNSFAAGLGLASFGNPSLAGGGNYAHGGARMTVNGTSGPGLPPNFPFSLATQLGTYLSNNSVSSSALYVIAGGGNDVRAVIGQVLGGADPVAATTAGATAFATAAATMVGTLKAQGASNIVVWNTPDVGKAPALGTGGVGGTGQGAVLGSAIASAFNSALSGALAGSGVTIFDLYGLVNDIVSDPTTANWNFSNVTLACGYAPNSCDPASALFWDGIHPTAYGQSIVAQQMLAAVPEPAPALLLLAGLLTLGWMRRRRA